MNKSAMIAGGICFAIIVWIASGQFIAGENAQSHKTTSALPSKNQALQTVQVATIQARQVQQEVVIYGTAEPLRSVTLRAETEGRIFEKKTAEGSRVRKGDIIATLAIRDREARLKEARASLMEREQTYHANQKLLKPGYAAARQVAEYKALLEAARARLAKIELEIENTKIRAPFDGILNEFKLEIGDYADINMEIATVVDLSRLLVEVQITQRDISKVRAGAQAIVHLTAGQKVKGYVRYISTVASPDTRTFRAEIEIANLEDRMSSGVSAEVKIQTGIIKAHLIPASALSVDDDGRIGVKFVSGNDRVIFRPVEIVQAGKEGFWVTGLPIKIRAITVGHGFVRHGQQVKAIEDAIPSRHSTLRQHMSRSQ